jgi:hypothetical protein
MTVEEIKAEVAKLPVLDRMRVADWMSDDHELRKAKLSRLKADIQVGLDRLERGEHTECSTPAELDAHFEKIKANGRCLSGSNVRRQGERPLGT